MGARRKFKKKLLCCLEPWSYSLTFRDSVVVE